MRLQQKGGGMIRFIVTLSFLCSIVAACSTQLRRTTAAAPDQRAVEDKRQYDKISKLVDKDKIRFSGGDGVSMENAIVIKGALNEAEGAAAENFFLINKIGEKEVDWKALSKTSPEAGGKVYDKLEILYVKKSSTAEYYFDVTEFFDKR
jgi:hypothetical protein